MIIRDVMNGVCVCVFNIVWVDCGKFDFVEWEYVKEMLWYNEWCVGVNKVDCYEERKMFFICEFLKFFDGLVVVEFIGCLVMIFLGGYVEWLSLIVLVVVVLINGCFFGGFVFGYIDEGVEGVVNWVDVMEGSGDVWMCNFFFFGVCERVIVCRVVVLILVVLYYVMMY